LLCCRYGDATRDDDVNLAADKLGRDLGIALGEAPRPAVFNRYVLFLDPAGFAQPLVKRDDIWNSRAGGREA